MPGTTNPPDYETADTFFEANCSDCSTPRSSHEVSNAGEPPEECNECGGTNLEPQYAQINNRTVILYRQSSEPWTIYEEDLDLVEGTVWDIRFMNVGDDDDE